MQQALLKIIEGCVANVPPQGGRKHPHQDFLQIKTDNILFMCGGAFEGMEEIIERRVHKDRHAIGFRPDFPYKVDSSSGEDLLQHINPDDLLEYGFIPEFVGRLPVAVGLKSLEKQDLIRVLTEPKNAFVRQYQCLFQMDEVELTFTDDALGAAADQALKQRTGARGLRTILEQTLLDIMYELPSMNGVSRCIVDADAILGTADVSLLTSAGDKIPMPAMEQKSA